MVAWRFACCAPTGLVSGGLFQRDVPTVRDAGSAFNDPFLAGNLTNGLRFGTGVLEEGTPVSPRTRPLPNRGEAQRTTASRTQEIMSNTGSLTTPCKFDNRVDTFV